jgi:hypothetical protein
MVFVDANTCSLNGFIYQVSIRTLLIYKIEGLDANIGVCL